MNNFKSKEKSNKTLKKMSSLQNKISFKHNKSEPEYVPYFYNNIITILNLKKVF